MDTENWVSTASTPKKSGSPLWMSSEVEVQSAEYYSCKKPYQSSLSCAQTGFHEFLESTSILRMHENHQPQKSGKCWYWVATMVDAALIAAVRCCCPQSRWQQNTGRRHRPRKTVGPPSSWAKLSMGQGPVPSQVHASKLGADKSSTGGINVRRWGWQSSWSAATHGEAMWRILYKLSDNLEGNMVTWLPLANEQWSRRGAKRKSEVYLPHGWECPRSVYGSQASRIMHLTIMCAFAKTRICISTYSNPSGNREGTWTFLFFVKVSQWFII